MPGLLERMFGRSNANNPNKGSSLRAKERLQFILVHDRIDIPPERMEQMKAEILAVIAKYVDIDDANVDIALQKRDRDSLLRAEIPFSKAYDESGDTLDDGSNTLDDA